MRMTGLPAAASADHQSPLLTHHSLRLPPHASLLSFFSSCFPSATSSLINRFQNDQTDSAPPDSSVNSLQNVYPSILTLSQAPGPNPWKVVLILEELGIPYEFNSFKYDHVKQKPFTDLNPNGRVPGRVSLMCHVVAEPY